MLPKGFIAQGVHGGIAKKKDKKDIALFYSELPATVAGMLTGNLVKAAPVLVCRDRLEKTAEGYRAIVANSGCANACTGGRGQKDALTMCADAAAALDVRPENVLVASTGVIGQRLPMGRVRDGIQALAGSLRGKGSDETNAVAAIMTTDTFPKTARRSVVCGGKRITVWGCAKGAGMIHPDLKALHATMLSFVLTDASVEAKALDEALRAAAAGSFNCVSVDGDTSTNDTLLLMANGAAENRTVTRKSRDFKVFLNAVSAVCLDLAKMIARDGEGATRLVEIRVKNAGSAAAAHRIAATIATSPLVKTAVFGNDANWGRVIAAAGRAGVPFDPDTVDIALCGMTVARRGMAVAFSEEKAKRLLARKEISISVDLRKGPGSAVYYTCDLSFDYVKINASYRS